MLILKIKKIDADKIEIKLANNIWNIISKFAWLKDFDVPENHFQ